MAQDWLLYIAVFACSFGASLLMTPYVKKFAVKNGAIDYPKSRGLHKEPIPRMGGLAIVFGFAASMLVSLPFVPELRSIQFLGFSIGAMIIVLLGMLDDIYQLNAKVKFLVQLIAAFIVIFTGTTFHIMVWPFMLLPGKFDIPLTLLWIVGLTNAVNLIDGVDGLAAGVSTIGAGCLMVLCILSGNGLAVVFTAAIAGSCLGFLPRNFSPAEIIMGDTGSTFLGFVLACSSLIGVFKSYAVLSIVVAVLALALPIFDTLFAMMRRAINRKPIMSADRGHLHHRLIDAGYSHKSAVLLLYGLSAATGIIAIGISLKDVRAIIVTVISLAIFFIMMYAYRKRL